MIGAKTVTSLALLLLVLGGAWWSGRFELSYLTSLDPGAAFLVGVFASAAGVLFVRFWEVGEPSAYYFDYTRKTRLREGETALLVMRGKSIAVGRAGKRPPLDLPAWVQRAIYVTLFACVALLTFDNRTVAQLADAPTRLDPDSAQYCPDPEEEEEKEKDAAEEGPEAMGCRLIKRAFELGYAKSLGSCGKKKKKGQEGEAQVCTRRRRDEPYLHYSWRRLSEQWSATSQAAGSDLFGDFSRRLETQWDHLPAIWRTHDDALAAAPRASHHLWTNLPDPRGGLLGWLGRIFGERACIERTIHSGYALRPAADHGAAGGAAGSGGPTPALLEQALIQLLFTTRYPDPTGYCLEFIVHWDAPEDACAQLVAAPEAFLDRSGALGKVRTVIERQRAQVELVALHQQIAPDEAAKPTPAPLSKLLSFQCLMVAAAGAAASAEPAPAVAAEFSLLGERFAARHAAVTTTTRDADLYRQLATLLAPGFRYGRYLSEESPAQAAATITPEQLAGQSYRLSRLEYLRDADIFLGHEWLSTRPDLLAVYPYQVHVKNFVGLFRTHYRSQRSRL